jgi:hypothetical protein
MFITANAHPHRHGRRHDPRGDVDHRERNPTVVVVAGRKAAMKRVRESAQRERAPRARTKGAARVETPENASDTTWIRQTFVRVPPEISSGAAFLQTVSLLDENGR